MIKIYDNFLKLTIVLNLFAYSIIAQSIITIDKTIQYQKIEGFGGNIENYDDNIRQTNEMVLTDRDADILVNDLGCTIFRHLIDGSFEPVNDNNNPLVADFSKFYNRRPYDIDGCLGNVHYPLDIAAGSYKKLKNLIGTNGDTSKIFTTVFSPQSWTKYVNCVMGMDPIWNRMATNEEELAKGGTDGVGGVKDFKAEFGEFCFVYFKKMKDLGINVDAFSIQNEPAFPEPYSSCVYSAESYAAVFKTVGLRLRDEGYKPRMIFTEDIGDLGRYNTFVKLITKDPISSTFADIAAVHSYAANGITAGSTDANLWRSLDKVSRQSSLPNKPRPFWQTETSGYRDHHDVGIAIYTALKYGKVNAWMTHKYNSYLANFDKPSINLEYYGHKHYFKYIRQGAVSVDIVSTDDKLLVTAFQHSKHKTLSIQIINADTVNTKEFKLEQKTVNGNPSTYKIFLTTPDGQNFCKDKGNTNASSVIKIPAKSIITLVGENSISELPTSNEEATTNETAQELMVYPNPSGGQITLRFANSTKEQIEIMDAQLKTVKSEIVDFSNETADLDISHLSNGIYYLKVKNQVKKVVINK